jgi:RimJ/RimL family protein N-acetyltransferase
MICPTIVTARLTLRAHATGDFADSLAMWSDPAVVRYIGGAPATAEEVWARLIRYSGLWSLLGYGFWLVSDTDSGAFLGEAGLADFRRGLSPTFDSSPEAGWAFVPTAHGKGFAAEAVTAILSWADETLRAPRTVCMIDPGNARSLTLAGKLGYRRFDLARYRARETVLLERHGASA